MVNFVENLLPPKTMFLFECVIVIISFSNYHYKMRFRSFLNLHNSQYLFSSMNTKQIINLIGILSSLGNYRGHCIHLQFTVIYNITTINPNTLFPHPNQQLQLCQFREDAIELRYSICHVPSTLQAFLLSSNPKRNIFHLHLH